MMEMPCADCDEEAVVWCMQCDADLCSDCDDNHSVHCPLDFTGDDDDE